MKHYKEYEEQFEKKHIKDGKWINQYDPVPVISSLENVLKERDREWKDLIEKKKKEMSKRYYEMSEEIAPKDFLDALDTIINHTND